VVGVAAGDLDHVDAEFIQEPLQLGDAFNL